MGLVGLFMNIYAYTNAYMHVSHGINEERLWLWRSVEEGILGWFEGKKGNGKMIKVQSQKQTNKSIVLMTKESLSIQLIN